MSSLTKDVWLGADNTFTLTLQELSPSGAVADVDVSAATSMVLIVGGLVHTQLAADADKAVDWLTGSGDGKVVFKLGDLFKTSGVSTGAHVAELHVIDPSTPNGVVWFSKANKELTLRVSSDNTP